MEDRYKILSAQELAVEDAFIRWVRFGENDSQWIQWRQINSDRVNVLEDARNIVLTLTGIPIESLNNSAKKDLWERISKQITTDRHKTSFQRQYRILKWTLTVAAAFALLIWISTARELRKVIAHSGEKKEIQLPENSTVTVNAGSIVKFNRSKFKVDREIRLEGEAFFNVNPGSKFKVITTQGTVSVMGTSFNVISRPGRFEVSCFTGKVSVVQGPNDKMEITGGEKCYAGRIKEKLKKQTFDDSQPFPDWTIGKYKFEDQPLSVVISELERQYGVKVKLSPGIEDIRYTGLFESGDLDKALQLITWPLHLQAQISGKKITISR